MRIDEFDVFLLVSLILIVVFAKLSYLRSVFLFDLLDLSVLLAPLILDLSHHALLECFVSCILIVELLHQDEFFLQSAES
jgi:hypothetical protein